jgi:hypothetical protein
MLYARALLLLDAGEQGPRWNVADAADALGMSSGRWNISNGGLLSRVLTRRCNEKSV